jgi:hypothetical protein
MAGFVIYIYHLIFIYCRYNILFHSLSHYIGIRNFPLFLSPSPFSLSLNKDISWMFVVLLHIFNLFSYALSRVASNDKIITEYQIGNDMKGGCNLIWVLFHYWIAMTERNKEKLQSWYLVSNLRFELRTSFKIRVPFNCDNRLKILLIRIMHVNYYTQVIWTKIEFNCQTSSVDPHYWISNKYTDLL